MPENQSLIKIDWIQRHRNSNLKQKTWHWMSSNIVETSSHATSFKIGHQENDLYLVSTIYWDSPRIVKPLNIILTNMNEAIVKHCSHNNYEYSNLQESLALCVLISVWLSCF